MAFIKTPPKGGAFFKFVHVSCSCRCCSCTSHFDKGINLVHSVWIIGPEEGPAAFASKSKKTDMHDWYIFLPFDVGTVLHFSAGDTPCSIPYNVNMVID